MILLLDIGQMHYYSQDSFLQGSKEQAGIRLSNQKLNESP